MGKQRNWDKTIFLAHASEDKVFAKNLYDQLLDAGLEPWLDSECIGPGMNWNKEINTAIKKSRFFVACFSPRSTSKDGFIQRELRWALSELEEKPPGVIYFIPAFLESNMELPDISVATINLTDYQATDISTSEKQIDFINYLLEEVGVVQKIIAQKTPDLEAIRRLISEGQIDSAFRMLKAYEQKAGYRNNEVILLMGRYNNIKSQNVMGTITNEQYTIQSNQVVYGLLEIIDMLEGRG